jgi:hypothetical protein
MAFAIRLTGMRREPREPLVFEGQIWFFSSSRWGMTFALDCRRRRLYASETEARAEIAGALAGYLTEVVNVGDGSGRA